MTAIRPPVCKPRTIGSPRIRELEQQFDAKASELRAAFVAECGEIIGRGEEA